MINDMSEEKKEESKYNGAHQALVKRFGRFFGATMISRTLGYIRDAAVAYVFGGEAVTDSFYTAFRVSNLLRRLFGEGALGSSFVPVFSRSLKNKSKEETQEFLNALFSSLLVILLGLTVLGIIFAPSLTRVIAPGFEAHPEKFQMTVLLTRLTFPFFFFICLAALMGGVLNSLKHFFLPAIAPAMLSIAEISYLLAAIPILLHFTGHLSKDDQLVGLALSVVVGGAGHFLIQVPTLFKEGFRLKFHWRWNHPDSSQVVKLMIPAIIGSSVDQVNAFVDTICATFLAHGSVSALYNSNRLMQLPLALFGIAVASVSLPTLSDHSSSKDYEKFEETIHHSLRLIVFTVMPASIGLIMLSRPIVSLLFEHGQFGSYATNLTSMALQGYCIGLIAYSSVKVLANSFYALHEPKIAVRVAVYSMLFNIFLIMLLMKPYGVLGLALATSIASWGNAAGLYVLLKKRLRHHYPHSEKSEEEKKLTQTFIKTSIACLAMGGYIWALLNMARPMASHWQVVLGVGGGLLIFLTCAILLRMDEQRQIFEMVGLPTDFLDD